MSKTVGWMLGRIQEVELECTRLHDLHVREQARSKRYREALEAVDIYFKALNEQWNANDGRVVSELGVVINASADCHRLCDIAGMKVKQALYPDGATERK